MEENTTVQTEQKTTQQKSANWKTIPTIITILGCIYIVLTLFGGGGESKAIEAAEKHAKQSTYMEIGVVPEDFESKVIFKDGDKRLIWVKVGLEKGEDLWGASYCVYTRDDYVVNCTNSMGGGYDFEEHLEEVKALFKL